MTRRKNTIRGATHHVHVCKCALVWCCREAECAHRGNIYSDDPKFPKDNSNCERCSTTKPNSTVSFTPGPWIAGEPHATEQGTTAIYSQSQLDVAYVYTHASPTIEDQANVRLIAAAPALVASIERMRKMFQYIAKGEAVQAQAEQGIIEASEALSLVRGREA